MTVTDNSCRSSLTDGSSLQVFTPGEEILSRIFFKQLSSMLASLSLLSRSKMISPTMELSKKFNKWLPPHAEHVCFSFDLGNESCPMLRWHGAGYLMDWPPWEPGDTSLGFGQGAAKQQDVGFCWRKEHAKGKKVWRSRWRSACLSQGMPRLYLAEQDRCKYPPKAVPHDYSSSSEVDG